MICVAPACLSSSSRWAVYAFDVMITGSSGEVGCGADPAQDFAAVDFGQHQIQQHEVGL